MKILILGIFPTTKTYLEKQISNINIDVTIARDPPNHLPKCDLVIITRFIKHSVVNQARNAGIKLIRINNIKQIVNVVKSKTGDLS